ncbi:hypothetical protein [Anaeromyxobacter oryzae]|uniref:Uncharacterized protein n=1 Tax=Anaeromyxobacter oryzae TaxID=2918170 RepID=A0ABM7WVN4_9BACT|nr:hypothetical protein [Anaeromyxobacter oryzae]BDG03523.1 hypothetical protein AMOR_25190 [Anaeromyxobacter oryzae]
MPINLCQRRTTSCGACCGLYNREDLSRTAIRAELSRRTRALAGVPRTPEAFGAAARALAASGPAPLFPSVRICPLLGFLDAAETRIGCLAHPKATGGPDLRDCGVYDVLTCDAFLCPSHAWLTEEEAEIASAATGDFHLYGLVVTDVPFLRAALEGVAARTGATVLLRHLDHAPFKAALRRLLALKEELAPGSDGLFGAFRPGTDGGEVPRRIDYEALGRASSPYDTILTCVGADPRSGNDLDALEDEVRARLDACARAFPAAGTHGS